jgi:hypothetical protein
MRRGKNDQNIQATMCDMSYNTEPKAKALILFDLVAPGIHSSLLGDLLG